MAIDVTGNTVNFGTYTISATPASILINGKLRAAGCGLTPTQAQGSVSGYMAGGDFPTRVALIEKFPFTVDSNASTVGDLSQARSAVGGSSSPVSGYVSGGDAPPVSDVIDKFPFVSDTNATDIAELNRSIQQGKGHTGPTDGYHSGGSPMPTAEIRSYPYASDTPAADYGTLYPGTIRLHAAISARERGYVAGGFASPPNNSIDTIVSFPFQSASPSTDVGELTTTKSSFSGLQSSENGYTVGGANRSSTIEKFPFASNSPASDVAEMFQGRDRSATQSSTSFGYITGGDDPGPLSTIEKFPFANDTGGSDVGEIQCARDSGSGHQV